jgi:hypothetical protein
VRRGIQDEGFRVAAGQPLLYSSGRFAYPIQHYTQSPSAQDKATDSVATLPSNVILFIGLDQYSNRDPLQDRVIEHKASEQIPLEAAKSPENQ